MSLNEKTKLRGLIEILCSSSEYEGLPIRYKEDSLLRQLSTRIPLKLSNIKYDIINTGDKCHSCHHDLKKNFFVLGMTNNLLTCAIFI